MEKLIISMLSQPSFCLMQCCVGTSFTVFLSIPPLDLLANHAIATSFQSEVFVARPKFEGHCVQKITAAKNIMAPVIPITSRVMRPSTKNVVAAELFELELDPELEPEPELEFEDEPESGVDEGAEEEALSGVVIAAELSVVEEAAAGAAVLDAAADPEPPKQSIPWPAQKNCTVPHVCPNLQVHSSSL